MEGLKTNPLADSKSLQASTWNLYPKLLDQLWSNPYPKLEVHQNGEGIGSRETGARNWYVQNGVH